MYTVVYGREWEDVAYFSSFEKAVIKLFIQSCPQLDSFIPVLHKFRDYDGVYYHCKATYIINHNQLIDSGISPQEAVKDVELIKREFLQLMS